MATPLERVLEAARLTSIARSMSEPLTRVFDSRWRQGIRDTRWGLIPPSVRRNMDVAVDVGANCGDWTAGILHLANPKRLIAFEPNPDVFSRLAQRTAGDPRVTCLPYAVGDRKDKITLRIEAMSELSSIRPLTEGGKRLHGIQESTPRMIQVDLVTLDDTLANERDISLLKVDVQGYEREVIKGAAKTLQRCACLMLEVTYGTDYYEGADGFLALAKQIIEQTPLRLSCVSEPSLGPDGLGVWADAIFVRPG